MNDLPPDDLMSNGRNVAGRITWDINVSTVLILLCAIGTGMYFVAQSRSQTEQAQRDIVELKATLKEGLAIIRGDLAGLPDQRARLNTLDERFQEVARWRSTVEEREGASRDLLSQIRSDVELLKAQAGLPPNPIPRH